MNRSFVKRITKGHNCFRFSYKHVSGYLLIALIAAIIFGACADWNLFDKSVPKGETRSEVDMAAIKLAQSNAVEAFNSSSQEAVNALCFDEAKSIYANQYSTEELNTIGTYLEKARLTSVSSLHAEYTYKIDKVEYTLTMGIDGDGNWKIVRY
jgi:hypothetical protein